MATQYRKGEYVRYAVNGVCLVEDVRRLPEMKTQEEFYILRPIADRNSTFFIPVTSEKLTAKMRPLLTREEIDAAIDAARSDGTMWIEDRKARQEYAREVLRECDVRRMIVLAATLYLRRQALLEQGRKLTTTDEATLRQAENLTDNEFAFVLGLPAGEVGTYVRARLGLE